MSDTDIRIRRLLLDPAAIGGIPIDDVRARIAARLSASPPPAGTDAERWSEWVASAVAEAIGNQGARRP